jgi:hypothetical protein
LPSPPATTSPEGISFEFPDATDGDDVPELALTPGTSFALSEQENNPELAMKQELDFMSRKLASSPAYRREETLSPLSSLEDDEQHSISTHKPPAAVANIPSSSTRREESLPSMSSDDEQPISKLRHGSLLSMSSEDDQPLSKSHPLIANITPSSAPREKSLSAMSSGGDQPLSKPPAPVANTPSPSARRSEFVSQVSSSVGQPLSKSRALTASVPSSSVRREESPLAISFERTRLFSKSPVLAASIPAPIGVPAREPRRSKRKRNVNSPSQNQQQAKKVKKEMVDTSVTPAKKTSVRRRSSRSQTVKHSHQNPKSNSRSASKSVALVLCEWPAKTQGEGKFQVSPSIFQFTWKLSTSLAFLSPIHSTSNVIIVRDGIITAALESFQVTCVLKTMNSSYARHASEQSSLKRSKYLTDLLVPPVTHVGVFTIVFGAELMLFSFFPSSCNTSHDARS